MDKAISDILRKAVCCDDLGSAKCDFTKGRREGKELGFIPRGFAGATHLASDVKLVLVAAEPGDPADGETYNGDADDKLKQIDMRFREFIEGDVRREGRLLPFHRNLKALIDECWRGLPELTDIWRHTYYTNSVLCSAKENGGTIKASSANHCIEKHLRGQLSCFPSAFVVAVGGKSFRRLKSNGIEPHARALHPSCRQSRAKNYRGVAQQFRTFLQR